MKSIFISTFLVLSFTLLGCSIDKPRKDNVVQRSTIDTQQPQASSKPPTLPTPTVPPPSSSEQRVFTLDELKKYNGQNGNGAYIAIDGLVYDVTNAPKWQNGRHQRLAAGNDLSKDISSSPHGKDILKSLSVVGVIKH